ncbi:MAG TPA: hypothetical protein VFB16_06940 [Bauldia sp.]|nr:hypothetical protein [Bauldia sp.]
MLGLGRFAVGLAGGFAGATSKVLALDVGQLAKLLDQGNMQGLNDLKVTIYIFTPVLMILGGLIAWATAEENRAKLLAIGCAAPAIIAPWTSHSPSNLSSAFQAMLASPALAQDVGTSYDTNPFFTGLKALLGIETIEDQKYWVIVGSDADIKRAEDYAKAINSVDPGLQAFVGKPQPGNPFFPIIVGGPNAYLPLDSAKALLARATENPLIPGDAYLSNYPDRLPSPAR